MKRTFLKPLVIASLAAIAAVAAPVTFAQSYPTKPIRLVVPFAPAGPTDIAARVIARKISEQMGQTIVIDNKPGAGGTIGSGEVARAPADGYTLLYGSSSTLAVSPALYPKLPYGRGQSIRAGEPGGARSADHGDQRPTADQQPEGIRRVRQEESGQGLVLDSGYRIYRPPCFGTHDECSGHQGIARALQGRRAGYQCGGCRRNPIHHRCSRHHVCIREVGSDESHRCG